MDGKVAWCGLTVIEPLAGGAKRRGSKAAGESLGPPLQARETNPSGARLDPLRAPVASAKIIVANCRNSAVVNNAGYPWSAPPPDRHETIHSRPLACRVRLARVYGFRREAQ